MKTEIRSSDLKQIIRIEKLINEINDYGILIDKWHEIITTRAKVINIDGSESEQNNGTQSKIQIEVYIRYNPLIEVSTNDRIKFKEQYFNITYIDNLNNNNKWLKIKGVKIE